MTEKIDPKKYPLAAEFLREHPQMSLEQALEYVNMELKEQKKKIRK